MANREIEAKQLKIDKVIKRVEEGEIKIPAFQRGYVWKQGQVVDLLDSIYKDYPIGSLLFWESKEPLRSTRNIAGIVIPERDPDYPVNYVLDGQQRLSTLYAVFRHGHENVEYEESSVGIPDHSIFDVYFNLNQESFVHVTDLPDYLQKKQNQLTVFNVEVTEAYIKLSYILDISKIVEATALLKDEHRKAAMNLYSKFINYEIPIVTVKGRSKEEVGVIFERINNTGTSLTTVDLMIAWTWNESFNLRQEILAIKDELSDGGFGEISDKLILQAVCAVVKERVTTEEILNLTTSEIKTYLPRLKEAVRKAIDYLNNDLYVKSIDFLPNALQFIPIICFYANNNNPKPWQIKDLSKWFWRNSFSDRYKFNTAGKAQDDIQIINQIIAGDRNAIDKVASNAKPRLFKEQQFARPSSLSKAFILLLGKKQPLNLLSGERIDLNKSLSTYNYREYHHIFPKDYLKGKGMSPSKINCFANICMLPAYANKRISSKPPSRYFLHELEGKASLFEDMGIEPISTVVFDNKSILKSNYLPDVKDVYQEDNYETFLDLRADLLYREYVKYAEE